MLQPIVETPPARQNVRPGVISTMASTARLHPGTWVKWPTPVPRSQVTYARSRYPDISWTIREAPVRSRAWLYACVEVTR